jgi:hypothetical protein
MEEVFQHTLDGDGHGVVFQDVGFQGTGGQQRPKELDIAIVGGGIAGLYCGYRLTGHNNRVGGQKAISFCVFEATERLGGRISTERILNEVETRVEEDEYIHETHKDKLEFCAEFGPMRIELDQQDLLRVLLKELGFKKCDFEPFPPYQSLPSDNDPEYQLKDEENAQPMDLLKLAFVRILGRLRPSNPIKTKGANFQDEAHATAESASDKAIRDLEYRLNELSRVMTTHQPDWKEAFARWMGQLKDTDYQNILEYGRFADGTPDGTPLYEMGFWNLLHEVLSHDAVMKIRDLGTFYHLIPQNPNAGEWLIFWLRGLKTSEQLVGISGGMHRIIKEIGAKISKCGGDRIRKGRKLVKIQKDDGGDSVLLGFEVIDEHGNKGYESCKAKHVILALPKAPLLELVRMNRDWFSTKGFDEDVAAHSADFVHVLDGVFGFPMLKLFVVLKEKVWEEDTVKTNYYATRMPTRELHYYSCSYPGSKKGMILLYTDRPASSFWANYVKESGPQYKPEWHTPEEIEEKRERENSRLLIRALKFIRECENVRRRVAEPVRREEIEFYGIRDWGREPYVGANHAWRPERPYWKILRELSAFALDGCAEKRVHICGEAYSDYHGFIEGALRSAAHALHVIADSKDGNEWKLSFPSSTPWLCGCPQCRNSEEAMRGWSHKTPFPALVPGRS